MRFLRCGCLIFTYRITELLLRQEKVDIIGFMAETDEKVHVYFVIDQLKWYFT